MTDPDAHEFAPVCLFIGCDRAPKSARYCPGHEKQLQRRGSVEELTRLGAGTQDVPPCRKCGGRDFSIRQGRARNGSPSLYRYCVTCTLRSGKRWRKKNLERHRAMIAAWKLANADKQRAYARAWKRRKAARLRAEAVRA